MSSIYAWVLYSLSQQIFLLSLKLTIVLFLHLLSFLGNFCVTTFLICSPVCSFLSIFIHIRHCISFLCSKQVSPGSWPTGLFTAVLWGFPSFSWRFPSPLLFVGSLLPCLLCLPLLWFTSLFWGSISEKEGIGDWFFLRSSIIKMSLIFFFPFIYLLCSKSKPTLEVIFLQLPVLSKLMPFWFLKVGIKIFSLECFRVGSLFPTTLGWVF